MRHNQSSSGRAPISFEIGKKLIIYALYYLLIVSGGLWVKIFQYFISRLIMSDDCGTFCHSQEVIIGEEKTLKIRIGVSLHSALMPAAVSELSTCHEKIRITQNTELLTLSHSVKTAHEARSPGTMIPLTVSRRRLCNSSVEDVMR